MSHGAQQPLTDRERTTLAFEPEAVGRALAARRAAEGVTTVALGERLRVDAMTITNYEHGGLPLTPARVLSYVYDKEQATELWRIRALLAEAALRRVNGALSTYRGDLRVELSERAA